MGNYLALKSFTVFKSYLILSLLCSLGYPVAFFLIYGATAEMFVCSMLHALCSAIVTYKIVSDLFVKANHHPNLATMFIVVNLVYFNASSLKYYEDELYPGFISHNWARLGYSILALLVLWISYEIIIRRRSRYRQVSPDLRNRILLKILLLGMLGFNLIDMYENYHDKGIGYSYTTIVSSAQLAIERTEMTTAEKSKMWLLDSTGMIMIFLVVILQSERNNKVYLVVTILVYFISSMLSGNRGSLFYFVVCLGFSMSYLYGYKNRLFAKALFASPIIIGIGSILILSMTARVSSDYRDVIKRQLAYRFDLTDYAATIINTNDIFMFNYSQIIDAIYYSVPQQLYPDKYEANKKSVSDVFYRANLNEDKDYTDTYFSIGSQLAGIIGFVLFPVAMIYVLFGFEQLLLKYLPSIASYIVIFVSTVCLRAESDLNSLVANWRMLPFYVVMGAILCALFVKIHKHSYSKATGGSRDAYVCHSATDRVAHDY